MLTVVLIALSIAGCKSAVRLGTPEEALESFFKAIKEDRIPEELDTFVISDTERALWRARCDYQGCRKVNFSIVGDQERGENAATVLVNVEVLGHQGQQVVYGKATPIRLERQQGKWGIVQFGTRSRPGKNVPSADTLPTDTQSSKGQNQ